MRNDSITYGVKTFRDFVTVNKQHERDNRLEALDYFALAVDMDEANWDHMAEQFDTIVEGQGGELGWAIIGFLIGLYAAQRERELDEAGDRSTGL